MASNSLTGINIHRVAERSLDYLRTEGVPLSLFTTDLGKGIKEKGETVTTRFANGVTSQDMSTNRTAQNASTVKRTVTLNQYRGVVLGFSDLERSYTDTDLEQLFIAPAMSTLIDEMIEHALSLVTTVNGFNTHQTVSSAASFSGDAVAELAEKLSDNKVPKANRNLIIPPSYLTSLTTDGAIQDASSYSSADPIQENRVPRLHGFNVVEYNGTIPSNSENMTAIATTPQSLVIVAREIAEPDPESYAGQVRSVIDPESGLPIQIRKFYSEDDGEQKLSFSILYGAEIGVIENASRIVSS